jgi:hypothetical protein
LPGGGDHPFMRLPTAMLLGWGGCSEPGHKFHSEESTAPLDTTVQVPHSFRIRVRFGFDERARLVARRLPVKYPSLMREREGQS